MLLKSKKKKEKSNPPWSTYTVLSRQIQQHFLVNIFFCKQTINAHLVLTMPGSIVLGLRCLENRHGKKKWWRRWAPRAITLVAQQAPGWTHHWTTEDISKIFLPSGWKVTDDKQRTTPSCCCLLVLLLSSLVFSLSKTSTHYGMSSSCNLRCNASWWRLKWKEWLPKLETCWAIFSSRSSRANKRFFFLPAIGSQYTCDANQMSASCFLLRCTGRRDTLPFEAISVFLLSECVLCLPSISALVKMLQDFYCSPEAQQDCSEQNECHSQGRKKQQHLVWYWNKTTTLLKDTLLYSENNAVQSDNRPIL